MNQKLLYFLLLPAFISLVACQGDVDILPGKAPQLSSPNLESLSSVPYPPGVEFGFELRGDTGSTALMTFEVKEEGHTIDESRIRINSREVADNPYVIPESEMNGFAWYVKIRLQEEDSVTRRYEAILKDENGHADRLEWSVETKSRKNVSLYAGRLEHSETNMQTGALDMDDGRSLALGDSRAELENKGADNGMWRFLRPVNGSILRAVAVDFGQVEYADEIEEAYDNGTLLDCPEAVEGEVFALRKGNRYYLLSIDSFQEDPQNGFYRINIQIKR